MESAEQMQNIRCYPFDETIVLDADMLVLEDITHWWKALSNYELYYTIK